MPDDLRNQDKDSTRRRLEAAPPSEVVKWAASSLRDYNSKLESLEKESRQLTKEAELTSVELKRIKSLAPASSSGRVSYLRDMHRSLVSANRGIGRTLNSCRQAVKEAVTNYQFIRQTINHPLADKNKKISAQQTMSRSVQDLNTKFASCSQAVAKQRKLRDQLSQAVTKLLNQLKQQLPNYEKERVEQEDKVAKIALDYQKPQPKLIAKNVSSVKSLGTSDSSKVGLPELAALFLGVAIGVRLFR